MSAMRTAIGAVVLLGVGGVGFVLGRAPAASASDEHASHDAHVATSPSIRALEDTTIPASGATAAERLAKSPRHGEWVAIQVGASDSVMASVVYTQRRGE